MYTSWQSVPPRVTVPEHVIGTAVIIGGGVSGLATAIVLIKFGMEVHVCSSSARMQCSKPCDGKYVSLFESRARGIPELSRATVILALS